MADRAIYAIWKQAITELETALGLSAGSVVMRRGIHSAGSYPTVSVWMPRARLAHGTKEPESFEYDGVLEVYLASNETDDEADMMSELDPIVATTIETLMGMTGASIVDPPHPVEEEFSQELRDEKTLITATLTFQVQYMGVASAQNVPE